MHKPYSEFIERDSKMSLQRMIYIALQSLTEKGIQEGLFRGSKTDLSMRSIYNKLFPSTHNSSDFIEAHRLRLYVQDGMEKEALEQLRKIKYFDDKTIFFLLNQSFLFATVNKMANVIEAFFLKGFPRNVNTRIFGSRSNIAFPTYFLLALAVQNLAIIMLFFKRTIDYHESWHGLGPVHLAAVNSDIRVLDMVLTYGGSPMEFTTTLQYCLLNNLFKKQDMQYNVAGRPIYPVDLAAVSNNWGCFLLLMNKCPKCAVHSQHLLHILNSLEMIIKAINIGARIDIPLEDSSTILHTKTYHNKPELVSFYIALNLPIDALNRAHVSPLSLALELEYREVAWVLLMNKAKISESMRMHPIIQDIQAGWKPDSALLDKIEYYKHAASYVEIVDHKPKGRFSIRRILTREKSTLEDSLKKLNQKIERVEKSAEETFKALPKEELYEKFTEVVGKTSTKPQTPFKF
ncbi:hypothetical protein NERG_01766 [Nematocida ausubeli]|uniref:Uncharacterized protein n=1 Tax=Nematocida ausubeli (strain ATCC PRA-371 / ERTm2) TaxID=1913371 RepID=H8ZDU5_NEMA1|nr:hypothetical protein NERG_01766 [Nematocida ausubeli]